MIPSLHTCMNPKSDTYLLDQAWGCTCGLWEEAPKRFTAPVKLGVINESV